MISPQLAEHSAKLRSDRKLPFPIAYDSGNEIADAFSLKHRFSDDLRKVYESFGVDIAAINGDAAGWTLPLPARYIVDESGTVLDAAVNADYKRRPEVTRTIDKLRKLAD